MDKADETAWTPESFEAAERSLLAEEEAEAAYQARQRAREAAEDAWVDHVVAEQEALAAARQTRDAATAPAVPSAPPGVAGCADGGAAAKGAALAAADWERWELALAPLGLGLVPSGELGGGGRGLAATRGFARGEVILRASPTAFVVNDANLRECCHHCLARHRKLLGCSACGCARYCSVEHQRAAWPEHRAECALLARTRPRVPGQTIRLLARMLSQLRRSAESGGAAEGGKGASGGAESSGGSVAAGCEAGRWAAGAGGALSLRHQLAGQTDSRARQFREQAAMLCSLIADVASGKGASHGGGGGGSHNGGGGSGGGGHGGGGGGGRTGGSGGGGSVDGGSGSGGGAGAGWGTGGGNSGAGGWVSCQSPPLEIASEMLSRLSLNCHTICDDELVELGIGLYPLAALANHACLPTASQTFGPHADLTLRALVPLAPGDEVTIAYIDLSPCRTERRAALREAYLFDCRCAACFVTPGATAAAQAAREADRSRMARALSQSRETESRALDAGDFAAALAEAERGCELAGQLLPATSPALGLHLFRAAKLHAHCGSIERAADFARRAVPVLTVTHGEEAALVRQATELLRGAQMELAFGPRDAPTGLAYGQTEQDSM